MGISHPTSDASDSPEEGVEALKGERISNMTDLYIWFREGGGQVYFVHDQEGIEGPATLTLHSHGFDKNVHITPNDGSKPYGYPTGFIPGWYGDEHGSTTAHKEGPYANITDAEVPDKPGLPRIKVFKVKGSPQQ